MADVKRWIGDYFSNKAEKAEKRSADARRKREEEVSAGTEKDLEAEQKLARRELRRARAAQVAGAVGRGAMYTGMGAAKAIGGTAKAGYGLMTGTAAMGGYIGSKIKEKSMLVDFFFFWAILVHFIDIGTGFSNGEPARIPLHFLTAVLAIFIFGSGSWVQRVLSSFFGVAIAFVAAILIAPITNLLSSLIKFIPSPQIATVISGFVIAPLAPIWVYFVIFQNYKDSFMTRFAKRIWLILVIIAFFTIITEAQLFAAIPGGQIVGEQYQQAADVLQKLWNGILNLPKNTVKFTTDTYQSIKEGVNRQYLIAAGDYYTGTVDRNVKESLGVYIEKVKAADPKYYVGDNVIVYGLLRARTLDVDKPIKIKYNCYKEEGDSKIPSSTTSSIFSVESFDVFDLECGFKNLKEGTHSIKLTAEFEDFPTYGYVKAYFMDRQRLRDLLREEIDPLERFGITDKKPQAVYTNGPVMLGMGTTSEIVRVDTSTSQTDLDEYDPYGLETSGEPAVRPRLGITLDNNWKGEVIGIKEIYLQIPKQMSIEGIDDCGPKYNVRQVGNKEFSTEVEKDDNYNTYKLERILGSPASAVEESKTPTTILCTLNIGNTQELLGDTPVAIKYFRAKVNYKYRVTEQISVMVNRLPSGYTTSGSPTDAGLGGITSLDSLQRAIKYASVNNVGTFTPQKKCYCGEKCLDYANYIYTAATSENIDPLLVLAIMIQESECIEGRIGGLSSYGLMQVNTGSADGCLPIWKEDAAANVACGVKILKEKYNLFLSSSALCEVDADCTHKFKTCSGTPCCNGQECRAICQKPACMFEFTGGGKSVFYNYEQAPIRAYNGWGPTAPDKEYVERVVGIRADLFANSVIIS